MASGRPPDGFMLVREGRGVQYKNTGDPYMNAITRIRRAAQG